MINFLQRIWTWHFHISIWFTLHLLMDNVFFPFKSKLHTIICPIYLGQNHLNGQNTNHKKLYIFSNIFLYKISLRSIFYIIQIIGILYVFSIELTETFRNIFFHFTGSVHFKLLKLLSIFIPEQIQTNFVHKINVDYISLVSVKF